MAARKIRRINRLTIAPAHRWVATATPSDWRTGAVRRFDFMKVVDVAKARSRQR